MNARTGRKSTAMCAIPAKVESCSPLIGTHCLLSAVA